MFLDALPGPLARVDVPKLVTNLDGSLRMFGGRSQAVPMEVVHVSSRRPPFAQMSTCVLESKTVARAVLSHVRANPFFAGVSIVVHPRPELDAPVLVADLRILPTGRSKLHVDACGPATHRPDFMKRFHHPLARVLDGLPRSVRKHPLPKWMAPMSGGCGASLTARPLGGRDLERVLLKYLDVYLAALPGSQKLDHANGVHALGDLFKTNSAAGRYLSRSFGADFSERYQNLVWNLV
jgi:hypothetical protein